MLNIKDLKHVIRANNLDETLFKELANVPQSAFDSARGRKEGAGEPCPYCGGNDRFKVKNEYDGTFLLFCRRGCFNGKMNADLFDAISKARNVGLSDARKIVEDYLITHGYVTGYKGARR